MDLLLIFLVFVTGFGSGYYVSDRLLKRKRPLISPPKPEGTEPNLLDFKPNNMSDLWHTLRKRPPHS